MAGTWPRARFQASPMRAPAAHHVGAEIDAQNCYCAERQRDAEKDVGEEGRAESQKSGECNEARGAKATGCCELTFQGCWR